MRPKLKERKPKGPRDKATRRRKTKAAGAEASQPTKRANRNAPREMASDSGADEFRDFEKKVPPCRPSPESAETSGSLPDTRKRSSET